MVDEKRPVLDYHRNAVIHRYVAPAIAASALRAGGAGRPLAEVRGRAAWLSRLFKLEFMYEPGADARQRLRRRTSPSCSGSGRWWWWATGSGRARSASRCDFLADFLRPYLEAYRLAGRDGRARLLADAARQPLDRKGPGQGRPSSAAGPTSSPVASPTREALSKATLENSVDWLLSTGRIVDRSGRLHRSPRS